MPSPETLLTLPSQLGAGRVNTSPPPLSPSPMRGENRLLPAFSFQVSCRPVASTPGDPPTLPMMLHSGSEGGAAEGGIPRKSRRFFLGRLRLFSALLNSPLGRLCSNRLQRAVRKSVVPFLRGRRSFLLCAKVFDKD
ncbi:hypothetical protein CDAR_498581 [Caerostris darwini]|uniref:Uncharacterized protein n=1 Tax=Caerostris darwini TaxID=1538125 RepID=A0AAV4SJ54_9ARAC|nr:hypothetical protein CDAR_498581 [Caerostris darwini]